MTVMERLANSIVVPVVVLDKVEDAIPTAKAMAAGGVDTMEITFRTACAPACIKAVAELGYLPGPGIEPGSPELHADSLPTELQGKIRKRLQFGGKKF